MSPAENGLPPQEEAQENWVACVPLKPQSTNNCVSGSSWHRRLQSQGSPAEMSVPKQTPNECSLFFRGTPTKWLSFSSAFQNHQTRGTNSKKDAPWRDGFVSHLLQLHEQEAHKKVPEREEPYKSGCSLTSSTKHGFRLVAPGKPIQGIANKETGLLLLSTPQNACACFPLLVVSVAEEKNKR